MSGNYAGGLVGSGDASLKNCYAAGFVTGGANTAGLATGSAVVSTGGGVYSIVRVLKDNSLQPPVEPLADGLAEVDGGNAHYLFTADGTEGVFGAPFKSVTAGRTHAYDPLFLLRRFHDHSSNTLWVHNALIVGDEVVLGRVQGGKRFVVLDRIKPIPELKGEWL